MLETGPDLLLRTCKAAYNVFAEYAATCRGPTGEAQALDVQVMPITSRSSRAEVQG